MLTLHLNQFCCCCTTRLGSLVIGTLGSILTLFRILSAVYPRDIEGREDLLREALNDHIYFYKTNFDIYFKVGYALVSLLLYILLSIGVYRKVKRLMLPWLIFQGFEGAIITITTVILFFLACIHGKAILFLIFWIFVLVSVPKWYFWLCVWSHYKDLIGEPAAEDAANTIEYLEKQYNIA